MKQTQSEIAMRSIRVMDTSTSAVASRTSHALANVTGQECAAHDVEEDSFELSVDGEKYAGGSYYIDRSGNLILASVTPQIRLGNINNPQAIEDKLRTL